MAYIYKIENDINKKIYIGKTENSLEKRFQEHCRDAHKNTEEHRPLYAAIKKYGEEHFHISLIEETDNPNEREVYWIEQKQSFKYGYNATKGGDGSRYIDYEQVILTYNKVQNCKEVARLLNISIDSVCSILKNKNIPIKTAQEVNKIKSSKIVAMFNKEEEKNNPLKVFSSLKEAAEYLIKNNITSSKDIKGVSAHIGQVCNKKRKNAYSYYWEFL